MNTIKMIVLSFAVLSAFGLANPIARPECSIPHVADYSP